MRDFPNARARSIFCAAAIQQGSQDPETVGQYAGIRTYKNGRKIFEGDIIKVNDFWTGVVVWEFNDTSFEVEPNDEMEVMECLGVVVNGNKVEVIGNIFDNPQLLEGGEDN